MLFWSPVSEIPGTVLSKLIGEELWGRGKEMLSQKRLLQSEFAGGAAFPVSLSSRFGFTLPAVKS